MKIVKKQLQIFQETLKTCIDLIESLEYFHITSYFLCILWIKHTKIHPSSNSKLHGYFFN